ncbi:MAG: hypothetical protein G01um10145_906 [Microgenomates group bacterium Gr01-1014_5]|nr:MAG: hypothetical protein G01um10145_906 [Microgenomates group bacterium Gr01-1014_5]
MTKVKVSVLFATFSLRNQGERTSINGMIEPMVSVVMPKVERFTILEQPHPGSDAVIPFIEDYQNKKLKSKSRFFLTSFLLFPFLKLINSPSTSVIFKIRDFLSVFEFAIGQNKKYDLFIGLESINAIAGIFLKKLGYFDKVVYLVSDYSTNRYHPKFFNDLYLWLDRYATTHSDFNWDVSLAMLPARIKVGLDPKKASPTIHVPNALYPKQIAYLPASKIIPNSLVFVGTLGWINGPDIAIEALNTVLKSVPSAKLHIYGAGEPDMTRLVKLTQKLKLTDKVIFEGFISDQVQLSNAIKKHAIALAPYLETPGSPRWWADATKIRLYLAAGLPVITTIVPPLGREVVNAGAGIITKDTAKDTTNAVLKLLKDKKLFDKMKKNAINRARDNTWENTYMKAFKETGFDLESQ